MSYRCPVCAAFREGQQAPCPSCGWKPKPSDDASETSTHKGRSLVLPLVAVVVVVLVGLIVWWWQSRGLGAHCDVDSDCNSRKCLHMSVPGPIGVEDVGSGMCTAFCETDDDCSDDMICRIATRGGGGLDVLDGNQDDMPVCVPTGDRLDEVLRGE